MSATHTPGPWKVRSMTRVYAPDGGEVAVATKADPTHRHAAEANARLMAAAPELLAALKQVSIMFGSYAQALGENGFKMVALDMSKGKLIADAAIASAEEAQ